MENKTPQKEIIIIKKVTADKEDSGTGAWKIALADMMTAMMAFFLILWLISSTDEITLKGIAEHFKPNKAIPGEQVAGGNGLLGGVSVLDPELMPFKQKPIITYLPSRNSDDENSQYFKHTDEIEENIEQQNLHNANKIDNDEIFKIIKEKIINRISNDQSTLTSLSQIEFIQDTEGLNIQIVDNNALHMFDIGTSVLLINAINILDKIIPVLKEVPNKIIIRGHTDSRTFNEFHRENNWTLSAARAESTRLYLEQSGVKMKRFIKIEGVADSDPYINSNKMDPRNRRINIILKY